MGRIKPKSAQNAWNKKYTVDPDKRQMGRAASKRRQEEAAKNKEKNKEKDPIASAMSFAPTPKEVPNESIPANLRYPYGTIDKGQDYMIFDVYNYNRPGKVVRDDSDLKSERAHLGDIKLPIPAQIGDSNNVKYGESQMNFLQEGGLETGSAIFGGEGKVAGAAINNMIKTLTGSKANIVENYFASKAVSSFGGNLSLSQVLARDSGRVMNPNLELLFSGPALRNFSYQFKFTPRFEKEAEIVRTILRVFKRNMCPKGSGGAFLQTPNIFEIRYMHNGDNHPYLNRIKMCALKTVKVNYTAAGNYATYNDGSPISITMDLSFTELMPIYNEDYKVYENTEDGVGY